MQKMFTRVMLPLLVLTMLSCIFTPPFQVEASTLNENAREAIEVLTEKGVISRPEHWVEMLDLVEQGELLYLDEVLVTFSRLNTIKQQGAETSYFGRGDYLAFNQIENRSHEEIVGLFTSMGLLTLEQYQYFVTMEEYYIGDLLANFYQQIDLSDPVMLLYAKGVITRPDVWAAAIEGGSVAHLDFLFQNFAPMPPKPATALDKTPEEIITYFATTIGVIQRPDYWTTALSHPEMGQNIAWLFEAFYTKLYHTPHVAR